MKRRLASIAPAFLALALAFSAGAQTPASPPKPAPVPKASPTAAALSPAQTAAVKDLFGALKLKEEVQAMPDAMINSEIARNPGLAPFRDLMVNWLKKYMTWQAMEPELTKLYGASFTEAELKSMSAFYRTPAGQKALEKLPEMMQRTAMIGAQVSQPHSEELKKQMTARGEELQKKQQAEAKKEAGAAAGTPAPGGKTRPPTRPPT
ncbi:MAG: DUF2059 domain-containing protein [Thermoanaerobaculia bacterium]